ncbi:MAG: peptidylprolyl isomerase [Bacteroidota bacterium]
MPVQVKYIRNGYLQLSLLLAISLLSSSAVRAADDETLARVGKINITKSEFQERYELTPWPRGLQNPNLEAMKKEFLHTLIAEKLWAQKAQELRFDTTEIMEYSFKTLEKMYVRDALYKLEITDKIKIPEKEILKGYFRGSVDLAVDFIYASDKKEIDGTYDMLRKGAAFDSILAYRAEKMDSAMKISFGQVDENLEDTLYNLKPGEFTGPFEAPNGYYIFRVKDRMDAPVDKKNGQQTLMSNAKKVVEKRYRDRALQKFMSGFFAGKKVSANGYIMWSLASKLSDVLIEKKKKEQENPGGKAAKENIYLDANDFQRIENQFGPDTLKMAFIEFEKNPVSFKQFMREFTFEGFYSKVLDPATIRAKLNSRVKMYIENEMLVREGYKRGLQNLPEVKKSVRMWHEYYLSQLYRGAVLDSSSATEAEARDFFEKRNKAVTLPAQVNIVEVLTDSLEIVEKVLDELKNNADIRDLAVKYTKREWARPSKGEFGFFPVSMYGEIGKVAEGMKIGEVYGPLKVPEGYSVFKLIGKKEEKVETKKNFDDVKDEVFRNVNQFKYRRNIVNYTAALADQYGVSINEDALKNMPVNNITMFAYRYMGFGGRITAVPMMSPFDDWIEVWTEKKKELP